MLAALNRSPLRVALCLASLLPASNLFSQMGGDSAACVEWNNFADRFDVQLMDEEFFELRTTSAPNPGEQFFVDFNVDFTGEAEGYVFALRAPETRVPFSPIETEGMIGGLVYTAVAGDSAVLFEIEDIPFGDTPRDSLDTQFDLFNFRCGTPTVEDPETPVDEPPTSDPPTTTTPEVIETMMEVIEEEPINLLNVNQMMDAMGSGFAVTSASSEGSGEAFEGMVEGVQNRQTNNRTGQTEGFDGFQQPVASTITVPASFHSMAFHSASAVEIQVLETVSPDRYRFFTQGAGNFQEQDAISDHSGFESDTWTGTVGVELLPSRHLLLGLAFTAGENDLEAGNSLGGADISGQVVSAYFSALKNGWFLDGLYSAGWMDSDLNRQTGDGTAFGATEAFSQAIHLEAGRQVNFGKWITGPVIGGDYYSNAQDAYAESGAGIFNLLVDDISGSSLESTLGWQISRTFEVAGGSVTARLETAWKHEFLENGDIGFTFETSPIQVFQGSTQIGTGADVSGRFPVPDPGSDFLGLEASLVGRFGDWELAVNYTGELLREDFSQHLVSLSAGFQF